MTANFIIIKTFTVGIVFAIGLGIIHGFILGTIFSYLVYGITCKKRNKNVINGIGEIIFGLISILNWRFEMCTMMLCSFFISVFLLIILHLEKGKAIGDYTAFSDKDFDNLWFDFIHESIQAYPVFFPLDAGHHKRDRSTGCVVEVGMGIRNKYQDIPVAKIKGDSGYYLCPLDKLIPNPQMKCRGSVVIASKERDFPCTVTLFWDEYTGYTEVKFIKNIMGKED
jgi:hypothetical protein